MWKRFDIKNYKVTLFRELSQGQSAIISCYGSQPIKEAFTIFFYPSEVDRPENSTLMNGDEIKGRIHIRAEQYAWYLDLLRNEGPVYAFVSDTIPNSNQITTDLEPVGEGDI
ncbi:MAG: hypothetical protein ACFFCW_43750 [Candidatus Hodarchaeota archaeon]